MTKPERRAAICTEIVRILAKERMKQGLSMNSVAAQSGLNQSTVTRLENNPHNPTIDSLLRIADVLKVDLGEVITNARNAVDEKRN